MDNDTPNASFGGPGPTWRERRFPPRHAPVWVRIEDTWRVGLLREWITADDPPAKHWDCMLQVDLPGGKPPTWRYAYDPRTIRPRYGDEAPGD